jgi:hypothetical protein
MLDLYHSRGEQGINVPEPTNSTLGLFVQPVPRVASMGTELTGLPVMRPGEEDRTWAGAVHRPGSGAVMK